MKDRDIKTVPLAVICCNDSAEEIGEGTSNTSTKGMLQDGMHLACEVSEGWLVCQHEQPLSLTRPLGAVV